MLELNLRKFKSDHKRLAFHISHLIKVGLKAVITDVGYQGVISRLHAFSSSELIFSLGCPRFT